MSTFRYTLQDYKGSSSRYTCPQCQQKKQFVRYIDKQTGLHLDDHVGRCNREVNCAYHFTPKQYFQQQQAQSFRPIHTPLPSQHPTTATSAATRIDHVFFKQSLKGYEQNHLVSYLARLFGVEKAAQLVAKFFLGTSSHWPGATIFWQIDLQGQVRTGKIMLYDPKEGKRVKQPFNHIYWVHKKRSEGHFQLEQCLFGLHQLHGASPAQPIGLVESEKTAVIASAFFPDWLWMAVGSLHQLRYERCAALRGRRLFLFPDAGAFDAWTQRAEELSLRLGSTVKVSNWIEEVAGHAGRVQGMDLADYLIQLLPQTMPSSAD